MNRSRTESRVEPVIAMDGQDDRSEVFAALRALNLCVGYNLESMMDRFQQMGEQAR